MITKDQKADLITNAAIEAAAMLAMQQQQDNDSNVHPKYGCWSDEQKDCYLMGYRAASAEMEKLIEQSFEAAREGEDYCEHCDEQRQWKYPNVYNWLKSMDK